MVYAYDEMSYEVGSQEIIKGGVKRFRVLTLELNFWDVTAVRGTVQSTVAPKSRCSTVTLDSLVAHRTVR
jgi:hypothetical protein